MVSDMFLLLAVTGWRSGEAKNCVGSELDLEHNIATLGDTKTGVSVRPLSDAAIDIIKRQKQNGSPYVFDTDMANPSSRFAHQWLKLRNVIRDFIPHTLRHSFASLGADLGLADSTIGDS